MTTAQKVRQIRKELVECGVDPFQVAAEAVARNEQLKLLVQQLEQQLKR